MFDLFVGDIENFNTLKIYEHTSKRKRNLRALTKRLGEIRVMRNIEISSINIYDFLEELCSHQRSTKIYAEALKNPKAFPAHKCIDKIPRNRNEGAQVYFGDSTPHNM